MDDKPFNLLSSPITAINIGVQEFGEALEGQSIKVIFVEWSPPEGGDQEMIDILDQLL
jgi:hypothetical protein